jgi:hypothetical protein
MVIGVLIDFDYGRPRSVRGAARRVRFRRENLR